MFKVGDLVTPDWEFLVEVQMSKENSIWGMGIHKIERVDGDIIDFVGAQPVGWFAKYWKLAVTPETVFKLIKKHAE